MPDRLAQIVETSATGRVYGGRTAEQRGAERRARLLDAALERFGTDGFAGATIESICSAARLNPRYFYEQFQSREELLGAVYERHVQAVLETVIGALADAPRDARARLELGLRAFVDATLADERAARINYFEMIGVSRELEARRRAVLSPYAEMIATQVTELDPPGLPGAGDRRLAAVALVGATDGLVIDWLSGSRTNGRDAIVTTLLDIFAPRTT
jgi:AcrR family transcriptional regulator